MGITVDKYCVICGISVDKHWYEEHIKYLTNIINNKEFYIPSKLKKTQKITPSLLLNYKKFVTDIKKLRSKFKWSKQIYLITNDKVFKNMNDFWEGFYGAYQTKEKLYETDITMAYEYENLALICHKSCYKLLDKELNYNLKIDDIKNKLNDYSLLSSYGKDVNQYIGLEYFPWISMILNHFESFEEVMVNNKKLKINNNNINFLSDPLKNNKNAKRIINIWKPIIKKLKEKDKGKGKGKIKSKTKKNLSRPSPSESATLYKIGQKKKGNDGNLYIIIKTKNNIKRWKKII